MVVKQFRPHVSFLWHSPNELHLFSLVWHGASPWLEEVVSLSWRSSSVLWLSDCTIFIPTGCSRYSLWYIFILWGSPPPHPSGMADISTIGLSSVNFHQIFVSHQLSKSYALHTPIWHFNGFLVKNYVLYLYFEVVHNSFPSMVRSKRTKRACWNSCKNSWMLW